VVNSLFNPQTTNDLHRHIDILSLRGIRYFGPYGRDGRMARPRDFTRNVIVNEFAGPEPSPKLVDAIVAYMEQIDYLPNPKLKTTGQLTDAADPAAHRGEVLFNRSFPRWAINPAPAATNLRPLRRSSAARHRHRRRLQDPDPAQCRFLGALFSRWPLRDPPRSSIISTTTQARPGGRREERSRGYLQAVGDAEQPFENASPNPRSTSSWPSAGRSTAPLPSMTAVINLGVGTIASEMREMQEHFGPSDPLGAGSRRCSSRPGVPRHASSSSCAACNPLQRPVISTRQPSR
jgi:hypothetical protein